MPRTIAIVGRPNVGKSTLFNRLVGKRLALVDDRPGVTRDLREGEARLGDLRFTVVDTAGMEEAADGSLPARMRALSERAIAGADLCLFLYDARAGVLPEDQEIAGLLRRQGVPVILLANKAEAERASGGVLEGFGLGLGEPLAFSAEHGQGLEGLHDALAPHLGDAEGRAPADGVKPIQIAVLGRPNAGKSTLVNAILGEDRLLTGAEAGITRDAIAVEARWGDLEARIFDTAGLRRKARVQERLEQLSVADALRAVRFAEVVILLMDAETAFETQDLRLADLVVREGRAVVIAINKWDLVAEKREMRAHLEERFETLLPQLRGAALMTLSASTGRGLDTLQKAVGRAHAAWNTRVPTAKLNTWLAAQVQRHPPPAPGGRRIKLRYATQAKTRPPTFVLFASVPEAVPDAYRRFLANGLRETFGLHGSPIRLTLRRGGNPYVDDRRPRRGAKRR
ncbi:MAG: ribosome biogenesis GTPase Der [Pseudomonadota bacterium]